MAFALLMFVLLFGGVLLAAMIADMTWRKVIVLGTAMVLIAGYFVVRDSEAFQVAYWKWGLPTVPPDEATFIAAARDVRALRLQPPATPGDAAALHHAESRLCALPADVRNWVGRVDGHYLDNAGDGMTLEVTIWPHVVIRTALFPDASGTLISAGSPMFAVAKALKGDDVVRFSGHLAGRAGACPNDPVDPNEMLSDPEFLFAFSKVEKPAGY